ncbi:MAG: YicC/YloC family endoribonuclease [Gammaproteobacteria bacterium]|nr:YicC/YloC family endoribonuclease [Gammaproteobacteria bacterium]
MIYSMTGFARQESRGDFGLLTMEMRSVNHRYLEMQFRLPEEFRPLETAIREKVTAALGRGKLDISLRWERDAGETKALDVNEPLVRQIRDVHGKVSRLIGTEQELRASEVLRWPGVIQEADTDLEPLHAAALALLDDTLAALKEARAGEGARMRELLLTRLDGVSGIVGDVRQLMPTIREQLRAKFEAKLAELDVQPDNDRLEQELVLNFQKLDVDEELDRLDSHVTEMRDILGRDEPVGRRLDFLMQEFNREANTLGSKSQDKASTKAAVDLKVLIEQMREQIQNIE